MKSLRKNEIKRKLRVAQVAPLWFTVPPKGYGGIERIVAFLCDELVRRGHEVSLFASPGSETRAKLYSVFPRPLIEAGISWNNPIWNLQNLSMAYEMASQGAFDIIHCHLDLWGLFFQNIVKTPTLHTMHNPMYRDNADASKDDRLRLFQEMRKNTNIVFISQAAKRLAKPKGFRLSRVIYNGIDLSQFNFNPRGGDHFVWIARLNKHKGVENAIQAAEKLGVKLILAGRIDPTQKEYFKNVINPHLSKKIQYVGGELTSEQLSDFYGNSKALLYPIEWEEPFGLVVAEAMACGTPVIAYRRGSMPELIKNGRTGFVVDSDITKLTEAMQKVETIDRSRVRKEVEDRFSKERMTDTYEKLYYEMISGRRS